MTVSTMVGQATRVLVVSAIALAAMLAALPAHGQSFKVLRTFHGKDGGDPVGVLVKDGSGNLYGTTGGGGSGNCVGSLGCGTAFKLDKTGKQVWLHNFNGTNGAIADAGLLRDTAGNLFGTTMEGGDISCNYPYGCGAVFELDQTGKERVIHKFAGPPDGSYPQALLAKDGAGNLYGTTYMGGTGSLGTVFKIDRAGKETVLYNFTGYSDGGYPNPGVILDSAGNLYGVTSGGGSGFGSNGDGVVYKVDTSGNETVISIFGGTDGAQPDSVLLFDSKGNLYGTTENGGMGCMSGCGTVFELSPQGENWSESVLYRFCQLSDCADGEAPGGGPLLMDEAGNLYGTTYFGGASHNCDGVGCGTVFRLDADGNETVLYSFTDGADGGFPVAGLITDDQGNLYGTTESGGATCYAKYTCGVVFKIMP